MTNFRSSVDGACAADCRRAIGIDRTVDKKQILDILKEEWDKEGDGGAGSDTGGGVSDGGPDE